MIAHDYIDEAEQIIADLEATATTDPYVITESKEIQYAVQYEREHGVSWWDLLRGRTGQAKTSTIRRLILGAGTQAMQQLSGINVTSYYLPTVLIQSVGLDEKLARLLAACNSVSYLLFSLIGIPNVERWGRRKMMMYAAAGQGFCYLMITTLLRYSELPGYSGAKQVASASIAFFFLYYVFFGIGWQGVPWLYPTEINSLGMRTKGAAIGTASNWAFNYMGKFASPFSFRRRVPFCGFLFIPSGVRGEPDGAVMQWWKSRRLAFNRCTGGFTSSGPFSTGPLFRRCTYSIRRPAIDRWRI